MRILAFIPLTILVLLINGCATAPETKIQASPGQASDIYSLGQQALTQGDYASAATQFRTLEQHYPNSAYTLQAQMELAYSYFKNGDYASAIDTSERFIRNYPQNENLDYAYYLRGLASYEKSASQNTDSPISDRQNNLSLETTSQYFSDLLKKFPDSKYAHDTEKRMLYVHEKLASYEIMQAKQYLQNKNYARAVIHARTVTEHYPESSVAGEAENIAQMADQIMATSSVETKPVAAVTSKNQMSAITLNADPVSTVTPASSQRMNKPATPHRDAAMTMITAEHSNTTETTHTEAITETDEIRSNQWLLSRDGAHYTIQLLSTLKEQPLLDFIKDNKLQNRTAYFKKNIDGTIWNTLVYGDYPDANAAQASIKELPEYLRANQPWIQNISAIQQDIENFSPRP